MPLLLTDSDRIARARGDLRLGLPIVIGSQLIWAAEALDDVRFKAAQSLDKPLTLAITNWRAQTLKARAYDGDIARLELPDRANLGWVRSVCDPSTDLSSPMKGPFKSLRDGNGETAQLGILLIKEAHLLPAALVCDLDGADVPLADLTVLTPTMIAAHLAMQTKVSSVISARVPLSVSDAGRVHVFRPNDGNDEHYAVEIGQPDRSEPVLTRLHSACFTGDLLGSLKCDCGPQLRGALAQMGQEGAGVLLYLNQEGRGIGLSNKLRAYALQDQGFDTVDANHRLGFEDDERDFTIGANILKEMGFSKIRLMTNNPAKIDRMQSSGLEVVERVPLKVGETVQNRDYLSVKAAKSGHLL